MSIVYAVILDSGYDSTEIIQLFYNESDAKNYCTQLKEESNADYSVSEYDII